MFYKVLQLVFFDYMSQSVMSSHYSCSPAKHVVTVHINFVYTFLHIQKSQVYLCSGKFWEIVFITTLMLVGKH